MKFEWCRLWHDLPNDPKFRTIARVSSEPTAHVIAVFIHLMIQGSANADERGRTQPNAEDLASALDLQTEQVQAILDAMQGRVLGGELLTGWEKRQPKREDGSAERAHNWRQDKKLRESDSVENARERTRTQTTNRRDGDGDGDGDGDLEALPGKEVLVNTEVVRTDEQAPRNGHFNGASNGSVRPSVDPFSVESQMQAALEGYMRMSGTPFARPYKSPDTRIVRRCLEAVGEAELGEVFEFLSDRFRNAEQSPRHPNGPRKYAWFVTVLQEKFGGRA